MMLVNFENTITTNNWLKIPMPIRFKIADLFSIPRSSFMDVRGDQVFSDGFTNDDLKHLTLEKMKEFTGETVDNLLVQLELVVNKIENKNVIQKEETKQVEGAVDSGIKSQTKTRRTRKDNKGENLSIRS